MLTEQEIHALRASAVSTHPDFGMPSALVQCVDGPLLTLRLRVRARKDMSTGVVVAAQMGPEHIVRVKYIPTILPLEWRCFGYQRVAILSQRPPWQPLPSGSSGPPDSHPPTALT